MNGPLTRAEAYCWVAWMLGRESDALIYKYPRTNQEELDATDLQDGADAFQSVAVALDPDDGLWSRALDKWDGTKGG